VNLNGNFFSGNKISIVSKCQRTFGNKFDKENTVTAYLLADALEKGLSPFLHALDPG